MNSVISNEQAFANLQNVVLNQGRLIEELNNKILAGKSKDTKSRKPAVPKPASFPKAPVTSFITYKKALKDNGTKAAMLDKIKRENPGKPTKEHNALLAKEISKQWALDKGHSAYDENGKPVGERDLSKRSELVKKIEDEYELAKIKHKMDVEKWNLTEDGIKYKSLSKSEKIAEVENKQGSEEIKIVNIEQKQNIPTITGTSDPRDVFKGLV